MQAAIISPAMGKPRKEGAAAYLGLQYIRPEVLQARLMERDQRLAADTRTEAQKWLGDPQRNRSALAHRHGQLAPKSNQVF